MVGLSLKKKKGKSRKRENERNKPSISSTIIDRLKTNLIRQRLLITSITAPPINADSIHDGERAIPPNNRYLARKISEEKPGAKGRNGG